MVKTLRAASILAAILLGMTAFEARADLDQVLSAGVVKIAVPESFPPFGALGADGKYEGYDVDVAKLIAEDLGVELKLVPVTSKQRIPFLDTGKVDLVVSSLGASPGRAKSIWFSNAYAPFFSGAFAPSSLHIESVSDLVGKKVGLTGGTLEDLELTEMAPDGTEIIRFGDNASTIAAYTSGQVDVLVTGNTVAAKLAADNPSISLESKFIINESPSFIGIRKGDFDLLQWVNVFILYRTLGGDLNDLSIKWFGQSLPQLPTL